VRPEAARAAADDAPPSTGGHGHGRENPAGIVAGGAAALSGSAEQGGAVRPGDTDASPVSSEGSVAQIASDGDLPDVAGAAEAGPSTGSNGEEDRHPPGQDLDTGAAEATGQGDDVTTKLSLVSTASGGQARAAEPALPSDLIRSRGVGLGEPPQVFEPLAPEKSGYRSSIVVGLLLLLLGFGGFAAWAVLAPLKSGTTAPGIIKLAGDRKTVQHLEGGIIKEFLVWEGDAVAAGQVLIRLDGNRAKADLQARLTEQRALLAKQARLLGERDGLAEVVYPPVLLEVADQPEVAELIAGETRLFNARKSSLADQLSVFESWTEGYRREIAGLEAERKATREQLRHIKDELESVEALYKKGLIDKPRLLALKRTAAGLTGQVGSLTSDIARTEQKIGEAQLRGLALKTQRAEEVSSELQRVETVLFKLKEELPALKDVVARLEIKAPRAGRVVNLRFHTPGGVIGPGAPILDIVPKDDQLLVEARVKPVDIDILKPGMEAQVQLTAYSSRSTPPLPGRLLQVSADRLTDSSTGDVYYQALVEIDAAELAKLQNVELYPGMPASVQLVAGERTPFDYLLSPIQAGLRKGWLED
jgi:HlyD family type I secretion membrane fusion protein